MKDHLFSSVEALWTAADAAIATSGWLRGVDWCANGISIDTRTLEPGDLFVALKAARDGHEFVAQALEKGASAALVSYVPEGVPPDAPLLIVPDVLAALEKLGEAARARFEGRVIAITGSVGKTSTKEMLRVALSGQGKTHAAVASYNNHWGVPLTLARMPRDASFAIIEIGMNHPGEIMPLAEMARPHVAMITAIAAAHLEAFGDIAGIAEEKASIFCGLEPGGTAILPADSEHYPILHHRAETYASEILRFGGEADTEFRLNEFRLADQATIIRAKIPEGELDFKLSVPGPHLASNALAALAGVQALGADPTFAALDLAGWRPPEGRGTREYIALDAVEEVGFELIDDAFNANPESMAAAISVLSAGKPKGGRRIAVLGDMLELGDEAEKAHRDLMKLSAMDDVELVHAAGPLTKSLYDTLPIRRRGLWHENAQTLAGLVGYLAGPGDLVLVKGSKGSKISLVADALRKLGKKQLAQ